MNTRVDFHAHVLPGGDHGCRDVEMALRQLRLAADNQIETVIVTPHFYPHAEAAEAFLQRRDAAWEKLRAAYDDALPRLLLGAEVLVCPGLHKMEQLSQICVEGTNVLLLEMPFVEPWEDALVETAVKLKTECRLQVVLAHAERYSKKQVKRLTDCGIPVQINAASFVKFGKRRLAKKYLQEELVAALGSDIHGVDGSYKLYDKAMKKLGAAAEKVQRRTKELLDVTTKGE